LKLRSVSRGSFISIYIHQKKNAQGYRTQKMKNNNLLLRLNVIIVPISLISFFPSCIALLVKTKISKVTTVEKITNFVGVFFCIKSLEKRLGCRNVSYFDILHRFHYWFSKRHWFSIREKGLIPKFFDTFFYNTDNKLEDISIVFNLLKD